jgi:hypothetical protein
MTTPKWAQSVCRISDFLYFGSYIKARVIMGNDVLVVVACKPSLSPTMATSDPLLLSPLSHVIIKHEFVGPP